MGCHGQVFALVHRLADCGAYYLGGYGRGMAVVANQAASFHFAQVYGHSPSCHGCPAVAVAIGQYDTGLLPEVPRWQVVASRLNHGLLYVVLLALPLTGWIVQSASNMPFHLFWLFPFPALIEANKVLAETMKTVHG